MRIRELTYDERRVWGECPVCHAADGQGCNPDIGFHLGHSVSGKPATDGVHLRRLQAAPLQVKEVPA